MVDERAAALLAGLVGQRYAFTDAAYGEELILGFGDVREAGTSAVPLPQADWMLSCRATPWYLDTKRGVVSDSRRQLDDEQIRLVAAAFLGSEVADVKVRNELYALTITASNGATLVLTPGDAAEELDTTWELSTPDAVLSASRTSGLRLTHPDAPFGTGTEGLGQPPLSENDWLDLLDRVARRTGSQVLHPSYPDSGIDAVLMTPDGRSVLIQVKTSRRELGSVTLRLPRLVIAMSPLSEAERLLVRSFGTTRVTEYASSSEAEIADLVEELARAA